jgi:hypothetical protein
MLPPIDPLQASIAAVAKIAAKIENTVRQQSADEAAVNDYIANGDPDDAKQLAKITTLRVRAEMAPHTLKRLQAAHGDATRQLERDSREFLGALLRDASEERERLLNQSEAILTPFAPVEVNSLNGTSFSRARSIAEQLTVFGCLPVNSESIGLNRGSSVNDLIERAESLIKRREEIASRGTWLTASYPAGGVPRFAHK